MKTVHQLRKAGYKIRIQHFRFLRPPNQHATFHMLPEKEFRAKKLGRDMSGRGGKTTLEISGGQEFQIPVQVVAFCSTADNFNRQRGVELCLFRAFGHQKRQERAKLKHIESANQPQGKTP